MNNQGEISWPVSRGQRNGNSLIIGGAHEVTETAAHAAYHHRTDTGANIECPVFLFAVQGVLTILLPDSLVQIAPVK